MKKILMLVMVVVMTMSLVACGGGETSAPVTTEQPAPEASQQTEVTKESSETKKAEFITMTFGDVTMNIPNVFSEVQETQGIYVSGGPDSAVTVTIEVDGQIINSITLIK
jgi:uncharacterized lipoprotein YehR (DUF1307 family)